MSVTRGSRGRFITLEGTEGVGKTSNLEHVCRLLREAGRDVVATREPGGTPLAESIRSLLLEVREEPVDPTVELLLVFAARAQHIARVIEPALAAGRWVVCDRFTDATFAYQGGGRRIPMDNIATLESLVQGELRPDLTLYLDVPVEVASQRIAERDHDRFEREQLDFFERVRTTYLERAASDPRRVHVVDAGQELAAVQDEIGRVVSDFLDRP